MSRAEALRLAPTVRRDGLRGGLQAWDGQLVDDARLVVALARTAAAHGATVLTRVAAEEATGDPARLRDTLTGETLEVRAAAVVNATGVWADQVDPSHRTAPQPGHPSGVRRQPPSADSPPALTVPVPGAVSRFIFALPAPHGRVYLGLTDEDAPGPVPDEPRPTDAEIDFLLDTVNTALRIPLTHTDIRGSYAGLRPLLRTADDSTADISREHAVLIAPSGLMTVVGGKLTTYRQMAQDAVDAAVAHAGLRRGPAGREIYRWSVRSAKWPATGSTHRQSSSNATARRLPRSSPWPPRTPHSPNRSPPARCAGSGIRLVTGTRGRPRRRRSPGPPHPHRPGSGRPRGRPRRR